jgi:predicted transcriptional regulator
MLLPTPEEWTADVRSRLKEADISFTDVGNEIGVHASGISRWLTDKVEPRLSTMIKIEKGIAAIQARKLAT